MTRPRLVFALALVGAMSAPASAPGQSLAAASKAAPAAAQKPAAPARTPDVIFVPTPEDVVSAMLAVAKVTSRDVLYDLGSGDGRIPIAAAKRYGARAVGIDIDPERVAEATAAARAAGVTDKVRFLNQDLFATDISEATVVTLYLLQSLNQKLIPKFLKELRPGTRIVSHAFDMGPDWKPEQRISVDGRSVYVWTVPKP